MKTVFLDSETMGSDADFSPLYSACPDLLLYQYTTQDNLNQRLSDASIVITNKTVIDRETLFLNPQIRCILVTATGVNNIDMETACQKGISVCNVTAYGSNAVAQHVFCLLLALSNKLISYHEDVRNGLWHQSHSFCLMNHPTFELSGKRILIVGHGETGRAVAKLAGAFNMIVEFALLPGRIYSQAQQRERKPLDELLEEADIVTLHCLLSDTTRELINARRLQKMKKTAFLINTARGGLVDETALAEALKKGRIAGAALDVLSVEPPAEPHVLLNPAITNLIVTPHMAWITKEARQRLISTTAENLRAFLKGSPVNLVRI
ncbi:MAG: D-2-hydroxyacid dehydrogenase [Pseudomonadales bacterium]|nr:D-2-hydroxyacid dehydrogenase [Pseudomonadales bacterium]